MAGVQGQELCRDWLSPYSRSRSAFNSSKVYKEFARSENARDFDISRSFPSALLARHGDELPFVRQWVHDSEGCAALAGVDVPTLKAFVNAAPGSGLLMVSQWLREHKLSALPGWCSDYRRDIALAAELDAKAEPDTLKALKDTGLSDYQARNVLTYVLNSCWERAQVDRAARRCQTLARVISFEYDGLVVVPLRGNATPEWEEQVLDRISTAECVFKVKAYRTVPQLVDAMGLKLPGVPRQLLTEQRLDWLGAKLWSMLGDTRAHNPLHVERYDQLSVPC